MQNPYKDIMKTQRNYKSIVFTGGPGGGKTSIIEVVKRHFGNKVAVVPEAATILYSGGFPRFPGDDFMRHTQRAIYYTVKELEEITALYSKAPVLLCDRGTLDGMAYWPDNMGDFSQDMGSTINKEYARYDLVLHLKSPKASSVYQKTQTRIESQKQSLLLDKKTDEVWQNHPNRFIVEEDPDFLLKINKVIQIIENAMPKLLAK